MLVKSAAVLALASLSAAQYNAPGAPSSTSSASSSAPTVAAAAPSNNNTIDVQVGNGGLVFSPSTVTAPQGATINFHFYPDQHSVAESDFNSPCSFKQGGIWSGFFSAPSGVGVCSLSSFFFFFSGLSETFETDPEVCFN
jgi:plastocyanin